MAKCDTFLAVLFLSSMAKSTILTLYFICEAATSLTQRGMVAEKSRICRSFPH